MKKQTRVGGAAETTFVEVPANWRATACAVLFVVFASVINSAVAVSAATLTTLMSFNFSNGAYPYAGLTTDTHGNLYGTTYLGGDLGLGTVYKLDATNNYSLTTLVAFNNPIGINPYAPLITDAAGNLYGTAEASGTNDHGTVFKLDASNNYAITTLVKFDNTNGEHPVAGLVADAVGNLYGTTLTGGANGYGTVFKLDASNNYALTTLVSFNINNGAVPRAGLIIDSAGSLYGTTSLGGAGGIKGRGTVFKLDASNNYALTTLVSFDDTIGARPYAALIADAAGNLYGTTESGGPGKYGTVFKLDASNNYALSTLAAFNGANGGYSQGGLLMDSAGNLFGTTTFGKDLLGNPGIVDGTVFMLDASNNYAVITLAAFNGANGEFPDCQLIADAAGNLYGTTSNNGPGGYGTVFQLSGAGFVVPEPATLSLLTLGAVGFLFCRACNKERSF